MSAQTRSLQIKPPKQQNPLAAYHELIATGKIKSDQLQQKLAEKLGSLAKELEEHRRKNHKRMVRLFGLRKPCDARGIYIYGGVGRGKSMLMDLFYENVQVVRKRRVHFHAFMLNIHSRLNEWRKIHKDENDPLPKIAAEIADESWLLCFDELQVTDIADAMIIGRLFESLFNEGVVIVATSNRPPDDLYKDGLQRQNFLPFIESVKNKLEIFHLASQTDYRMQHLKSLSTMYFTPLGKEAKKFMKNSFAELTNGAESVDGILDVGGRQLHVRIFHGDVAWFTFAELCEASLGAADYIEISEEFKTILLSDIPKLTKENRNEAKRFTTLIDELYEHKTILICSAEAPPPQLYIEGDNTFEFERTVSRLIEMQSERYIAGADVS